MALFRVFESSVSLIVCSFFRVTTMGDMKNLSGQLENFIMCFSSNNFSSSLLCWLPFTTFEASNRLRILHALPESTRRVVEMLPILMGILRGFIFDYSFSMRAAVLYSPLLYSSSYSSANRRKFTESSGCHSSATVLTVLFLVF